MIFFIGLKEQGKIEYVINFKIDHIEIKTLSMDIFLYILLIVIK